MTYLAWTELSGVLVTLDRARAERRSAHCADAEDYARRLQIEIERLVARREWLVAQLLSSVVADIALPLHRDGERSAT